MPWPLKSRPAEIHPLWTWDPLDYATGERTFEGLKRVDSNLNDGSDIRTNIRQCRAMRGVHVWESRLGDASASFGRGMAEVDHLYDCPKLLLNARYSSIDVPGSIASALVLRTRN